MAILFSKRERQVKRVLIVEDEPLVAFDNERFLADEGFEVVATLDRVDQAVAIILEGTPIDLVLADVNLSDGSGIDVARTAHQAGIAVLFVSGACPGEAKALAHGCLSKPYLPRDLLQAIEAIDAVLQGQAPRRVPAGFSLFKAAA